MCLLVVFCCHMRKEVEVLMVHVGTLMYATAAGPCTCPPMYTHVHTCVPLPLCACVKKGPCMSTHVDVGPLQK